ncbi:MAG: thiamine pyrophosphate-dependent enzyme [Acidimicrobiia bacterium]|nr:thiamine pyrophosphate-dependent enzyme [Acidimicrobiia bacterium]
MLGGRAPQERWGAGSLQEFDHVPVLAPITKRASTATSTEAIPGDVQAAAVEAMTPHRGPVFLDFPLDVVFAEGASARSGRVADRPTGSEPRPRRRRSGRRQLLGLGRAAGAHRGSRRVAGRGRGDALVGRRPMGAATCIAERARAASVPPTHDLAFSRTRSMLKSEADVVVVVGTPLDFRLSFGRFGDAAGCTWSTADQRGRPRRGPRRRPSGDLTAIRRRGRCDRSGEPGATTSRLDRAGSPTTEDTRAAWPPTSRCSPPPTSPSSRRGCTASCGRIGSTADAIVGATTAATSSVLRRQVRRVSHVPGSRLDPGPFGCLGTGMGGAIAARLTHPDRQVVVLLGDGAAGFSLMDVDTLVRHRLPVVMVVGNNGIWGLEKHPMQMLYGYDVAADLQPGTRYDEIGEARLGGAGEVVERPDDLGPALDRAVADSGVPYLVNVDHRPRGRLPEVVQPGLTGCLRGVGEGHGDPLAVIWEAGAMEIVRIELGGFIMEAEVIAAALEERGIHVEVIRNEHPETGAVFALGSCALLVRDEDEAEVRQYLAEHT